MPELSEPIAVLDHATGWFKDEIGRWHDNDRAIGSDGFEKIDYTIEDFSRSQLEDFRVIELRTVFVEGEELYALLKHYVGGRYRYPSIQQDWEIVNLLDFCVFKDAEIAKIAEALAAQEVAQRVPLACTYGANLSDASIRANTLEEEVVASIVMQQNGSHEPNLVKSIHIDVFPVQFEGENLIRFRWLAEKDFPFVRPFEPTSFDKSYYEVDLDSFKSLTTP